MLGRLDSYQNANLAPEHLKQVIQNNSAQETEKTAKEFEALFVQMTLKQMRPTPNEDGILNAGQSEEIFHDFLEQAIAKEISESPNNNFGIADAMMKQGF